MFLFLTFQFLGNSVVTSGMVQHLNSVVFLVCINELTNFERFECLICFLLEAQLYELLNCYPCRILVLKFFLRLISLQS